MASLRLVNIAVVQTLLLAFALTPALSKPVGISPLVTPDSFDVDATADEDSVDLIPEDQTTARTYIISLGVVLGAVALILGIVFVVRLRKRRLRKGRKKEAEAATEATLWEKTHAQSQSKREGMIHSKMACMRNLDARLPCRCPDCLVRVAAHVTYFTNAANPHGSTRNVRPSASYIPTSGSTSRAGFEYPPHPPSFSLPRSDENAHRDASVQVQASPPLSPHEHEWQLVAGYQRSGSLVIINPPTAGSLETLGSRRLSQMSPLSSLQTSIARVLEKSPSECGDAASSSMKISDIAADLDQNEKASTENVSSKLECKDTAEVDVSDAGAWLPDVNADWIYTAEPMLPYDFVSEYYDYTPSKEPMRPLMDAVPSSPQHFHDEDDSMCLS
ncbi:uncharacterized protein LAESUDRAFT_758611 [Laetiporus sulphureus 93-53]|uniref:Transmembrane protein n=1 Tax=Laetiporus sulphureus 93-53 TaxID=1314785 RepID=A0A165EJP2_9APHY|nr:uncharacterized protein LAESUDRAFT_758611 [Laetiporus sulphureus 93-53]KZT07192.1 hypothetical protein LAESUDRAFT_758611 [Laetiporus sulphureus 93-53]